VTKLAPIKPDKLLKVVNKLGYKLIHVKCSHHVFKNTGGKTIVIPIHKGKTIGKGLPLKIIKEDLKLTKEEFEKLI